MLSEAQLRAELNIETRVPALEPLDVLARARRAAHRRRWLARGWAAGLTTAAAAAAGAMLIPAASSAALLTVGPGSTPDVHDAARGRVAMPGGMYAWRDGKTFHLGYPNGARIDMDVTRLGPFDRGTVADVEGARLIGGPTGQIAGLVPAALSAVTVTVDAERYTASVACFRELPGWCAYVASTGHPLSAAVLHDSDRRIVVRRTP